MRHSLTELAASADDLADAFEAYEPQADDFAAPLPPLMEAKLAAFSRAAAEKELAEPLSTEKGAGGDEEC